MCERCRKRFTYKRARRGLSEKERELIAALLWLEATAARAAKRVGVHPNTVAKYYRIIGERIAADREAELDSSVYSDGWKAYYKLSHSTASITGASTTIRPWLSASNGLEHFRGYAKRRLISDHGCFKHKFRLFIREMEFRFNQRNDPGRLDYPNSSLIGP